MLCFSSREFALVLISLCLSFSGFLVWFIQYSLMCFLEYKIFYSSIIWWKGTRVFLELQGKSTDRLPARKLLSKLGTAKILIALIMLGIFQNWSALPSLKQIIRILIWKIGLSEIVLTLRSIGLDWSAWLLLNLCLRLSIKEECWAVWTRCQVSYPKNR